MKNTPKWLLGIIGIVALTAAVTGYYFLYYIKTPEYTVKIIKDAYTSHDVDKVHKHVDIDNIFNSYIDQALIDSPEMKNNPLAMALLPIAKNIALSAIKESIDKDIRGDSVPSDSTKENESSVQAGAIKNTTQHQSIKSISSKKIDSNKAEIYLDLLNDSTQKENRLILKANKLDDGTWKIYEAPNLYEIVKASEAKS